MVSMVAGPMRACAGIATSTVALPVNLSPAFGDQVAPMDTSARPRPPPDIDCRKLSPPPRSRTQVSSSSGHADRRLRFGTAWRQRPRGAHTRERLERPSASSRVAPARPNSVIACLSSRSARNPADTSADALPLGGTMTRRPLGKNPKSTPASNRALASTTNDHEPPMGVVSLKSAVAALRARTSTPCGAPGSPGSGAIRGAHQQGFEDSRLPRRTQDGRR